MGGSISTKKRDKDIGAFFIDERLTQGETLLKQNVLARTAFVAFIKGGPWADKLQNFEEILKEKSNENPTVWQKFGYKTPPPARSSWSSASSSNSTTDSHSGDDIDSVTESIRHSIMLRERYTALNNAHVFEANQLRAVLIAAILPIYLCSVEYLENKEMPDWVSTYDVEDICSAEFIPEKSLDAKGDRLQQWLKSAAALYTTAELEHYISEGSWIQDYKSALASLPFNLYLASVNFKKHSSKILYCNTRVKNILGKRIKAGAHIHEVFSRHCTHKQTEQVVRSVFSAKPYKRAMLNEFDACQLRALKPVYNSYGEHVYALGLESYAFTDPAQDQTVGELPFQQVDDLMLLLPLLIKFQAAESKPSH